MSKFKQWFDQYQMTIGVRGVFLGIGLLFYALDLKIFCGSFIIAGLLPFKSDFKINVNGKVKELACIIVVLSLTVYQFTEVFFGNAPIGVDHDQHIRNLFIFRENIETFGWHGYSHSIFSGYPIGYFYPPGIYAFLYGVAKVFQGLSLEQVYSLGFAIFLIFRSLVYYFFGRRFLGRTVGLILLVLVLLDNGPSRSGGNHYTLVMGVWAQEASVLLMLLYTTILARFMNKPALGPAALAGLIGGAALLCHPIQIFGILTMTGAFVFSYYAQSAQVETSRWSRWLPLSAVFLALISVLVAAIYIIPLYCYADLGTRQPFGVRNPSFHWKTLTAFSRSIASMDFMKGVLGSVEGVALLGVVIAFVSRKLELFAIAVFTLTCCLLALNTVSYVFPGSFAEDLLKNAILERFFSLSKPGLYFLAANFTYVFFKVFFSEKSGPPQRRSSVVLKRLAIAILLGPFLVSIGDDIVNRHAPETNRSFQLKVAMDEGRKDEELFRFMAQLIDTNNEFFRFAYLFDRHDSDPNFFDSKQARIYNGYFLPASEFKSKFAFRSLRLLEYINVKYIVTDKATPFLSSRVTEIKVTAKHRVYQLNSYSAILVDVPSEAGVVAVKISNTEMKFVVSQEVSGPAVLKIGYMPQWKAYLNGVAIETAPIEKRGKFSASFIGFEARPGELVFRYELGWPELIGKYTSIVSIIALMLILIFDLIRSKPTLVRNISKSINSKLKRGGALANLL